MVPDLQEENVVPQILGEQQFDPAERLACELRAIDEWDIGYLVKAPPGGLRKSSLFHPGREDAVR